MPPAPTPPSRKRATTRSRRSTTLPTGLRCTASATAWKRRPRWRTPGPRPARPDDRHLLHRHHASAVGFSYSMGRPILEAVQVAERVAAGNFSGRGDWQFAARRTRPPAQIALRHAIPPTDPRRRRPGRDGKARRRPQQHEERTGHVRSRLRRLMLWEWSAMPSMYRIPVERLVRVGCTIEELLEARRMAGEPPTVNVAQYDGAEQRRLAIQTNVPLTTWSRSWIGRADRQDRMPADLEGQLYRHP